MKRILEIIFLFFLFSCTNKDFKIYDKSEIDNILQIIDRSIPIEGTNYYYGEILEKKIFIQNVKAEYYEINLGVLLDLYNSYYQSVFPDKSDFFYQVMNFDFKVDDKKLIEIYPDAKSFLLDDKIKKNYGRIRFEAFKKLYTKVNNECIVLKSNNLSIDERNTIVYFFYINRYSFSYINDNNNICIVKDN